MIKKSKIKNQKSKLQLKIQNAMKCHLEPRQTLREIPRRFLTCARNDSALSTLHFELCTLNLRRGQALITLLFFTIISITITSAATIIIGVNSLSLTKLQEGSIFYYAVESGIENAILRAIRDPLYTGETLTIGDISVTITVPPGAASKTVTVVNASGNFRRTIEVQMNYNSGYYTILGWKEI